MSSSRLLLRAAEQRSLAREFDEADPGKAVDYPHPGAYAADVLEQLACELVDHDIAIALRTRERIAAHLELMGNTCLVPSAAAQWRACAEFVRTIGVGAGDE